LIEISKKNSSTKINLVQVKFGLVFINNKKTLVQHYVQVFFLYVVIDKLILLTANGFLKIQNHVILTNKKKCLIITI